MNETQKRDTDKYILWGVVAVLVVGCIIGAVVSPWFGHRLHEDFFPLDRSFVGPNLLASLVQWAIIGLLFTLLYPPFRHAVERFAQRHVKDIKQHLETMHAEVHAKLDAQHAERMAQSQLHHDQKMKQSASHHKTQLAAIRKQVKE